MPERLFTTYQVADLLGATPGAVVEWIQKGWLPVQRLPDGPLRITEKGLVFFLRQRGVDIEKIMAKVILRESRETKVTQAERDALVAPKEQETTRQKESRALGRPGRGTSEEWILAELNRDEDAASPGETETETHRPEPSRPAEPVAAAEPAGVTSEAAVIEDHPAVEETPVVLEPLETPQLEPAETEQAVVAPPVEDLEPAEESATESPIPAQQQTAQTPSDSTVVEPLPVTSNMQSDAPVKAVQITEALVREAMSRRATHMHLESLGQAVHIRLRIDGVLHDVSDWQASPRRPADVGLVSQFMSLAGLDEARHLPQSNRLRMALDGGAVDLRMDSCPTARGLRAVIAILDPAEVTADLSRLGLDRPEQMDLRRLLRQPCGMIVLAGRGAPRNEALRAMTASADLRGRSVVAVGRFGLTDSPGLTVVGAKSQDGLSFAQAIGTFARQDVDVIACEDLRDPPAAVAALDAAEAGKLVLVGINSPTAASAVGALFDMGLEPWPLAANLLAVIAYTRIRTLCSDCKQPAAPDGQLLELLGLDPAGDRFASHAAAGCPRCYGSGYVGTMGLLSVMMVDATVAPAIRAGLGTTELNEAARSARFKDLRHIGLEKARAGLTSLEELARILPS